MKIKREVYEKLINIPVVPPERGGILGGMKKIISDFISIPGMVSINSDVYEPDIEIMNKAIHDWYSKGLELYGIVHSHPCNAMCLSYADTRYIESIMMATQGIVEQLLFPIVIPGEKIIWYSAGATNSEIHISSIDIEIVV